MTKKKILPRLNPLAVIALRRYREELTSQPCSQETSLIVDSIDQLLSHVEGQK